MLTRREFVLSMGALAGASGALACPAPLSNGKKHAVLMLNAACGNPDIPNVFEPALLHVDIGDSVTFLATDAGHNSASKKGMIPEGAAAWNGGLDEELTVEFTVPGIYGHICLPHYDWGMVGLIVVGRDLHNLQTAKKIRHPGSARKVFRNLLKELENQT
ncbi:Pseudoazurin precursor [Pelagimonas phthalicica]|uniref:Pseudoazurin n=1 Tax=Pelagimonas phthalicica TaxID=1037362 RepID=A0A238J991_9RHOB|nr:pseudoazurin [Pelagimonas phthalicica]TDS94245.1 pseudoazurin [Pelagimonas phthalicica]SMX27228.1 Pseudoazurin precursor [Pelagimonas phthalicica]